jgi:hypothetical protein
MLDFFKLNENGKPEKVKVNNFYDSDELLEYNNRKICIHVNDDFLISTYFMPMCDDGYFFETTIYAEHMKAFPPGGSEIQSKTLTQALINHMKLVETYMMKKSKNIKTVYIKSFKDAR